MIPRIYLYAIASIAAAGLITIGAHSVHKYGDARELAGRDAVLADNARAAAQIHAAQDALATLSAAAGQQLTHHLGAALPAIEAQSHDTVETIRTIYRDRPVLADGCQRPDRVQAELNAAVKRANAAASGHL